MGVPLAFHGAGPRRAEQSATAGGTWRRLLGDARRGLPRPDSVASDDDPLVALLRGWLSPESSLLDVRAGSGRYALPLAPLAHELIAVEPSAAMAEGLRAGVEARGIANLRLIERR